MRLRAALALTVMLAVPSGSCQADDEWVWPNAGGNWSTRSNWSTFTSTPVDPTFYFPVATNVDYSPGVNTLGIHANVTFNLMGNTLSANQIVVSPVSSADTSIRKVVFSNGSVTTPSFSLSQGDVVTLTGEGTSLSAGDLTAVPDLRGDATASVVVNSGASLTSTSMLGIDITAGVGSTVNIGSLANGSLSANGASVQVANYAFPTTYPVVNHSITLRNGSDMTVSGLMSGAFGMSLSESTFTSNSSSGIFVPLVLTSGSSAVFKGASSFGSSSVKLSGGSSLSVTGEGGDGSSISDLQATDSTLAFGDLTTYGALISTSSLTAGALTTNDGTFNASRLTASSMTSNGGSATNTGLTTSGDLVLNNASVNASVLKSTGGSVTLQGTSFTGSSATAGGAAYVNNSSVANSIINGGSVALASSSFTGTTITGGGLSVSGVTLTGSTINSGGDITVAGALTVGAGSVVQSTNGTGLRVHNTGYISGSVSTIGGSVNFLGFALDNQPGGTVEVTAQGITSFTGASASTNAGTILNNNGTLHLSSLTNSGTTTGKGAYQIDGTFTNTSTGNLTFTGATNFSAVKLNNTAGGMVTLNGGATTIFNADVTNDGTIGVGQGSTAVIQGALDGNGTVTGSGTVQIFGSLRPGHSPGEMDFGGNLSMMTGGLFDVQIAGTTPGSLYDVVHVAGAFTAAGTLQIDLLGGFVPQFGDTFEILTYDSITGQFTTITGLDAGNGLIFAPTIGAKGISVQVVPEPSTYALMLVAGFTLAAGLYRKRPAGSC